MPILRIIFFSAAFIQGLGAQPTCADQPGDCTHLVQTSNSSNCSIEFDCIEVGCGGQVYPMAGLLPGESSCCLGPSAYNAIIRVKYNGSYIYDFPQLPADGTCQFFHFDFDPTALTTPGNISGGGTFCGTNPGNHDLIGTPASSEVGGAINYQWQYQYRDCGSWSGWYNWATTQSVYNWNYLGTSSHRFRRGARHECGDWVYSNIITFDVQQPLTDAGTISGGGTFCGTNPPFQDLIGTAASGGCGGAIEYQWQYQFRSPCGSWSGWYNWHTSQSVYGWNYTGPVATASHRFRRGARRVGCGDWIYSNTITFDVQRPLTDPGTISGGGTYCGTNPPNQDLTGTAASGGCGGAVQYQWQYQRRDNCGNWTDWINWQTSQSVYGWNYAGPGATASHRFRRGARRVGCGDWIYSNIITFDVHQPLTDAGTISGGGSFCNNAGAQTLGNSTAASGGCGGTIEYQWQVRRRSEACIGTWDGWTNLSGATNATYVWSGYNSDRQFRRAAKRSECGNWLYSNTITFEIEKPLTDPGIISGGGTYCGTHPPNQNLTGTPASGGCGSAVEYLWQYQRRDDCGNWSGWNNWNGQTTQSVSGWNYTGPASHRFRRGARRTGCGNWIYSNTITFDVDQLLTDPGTISGGGTYCGNMPGNQNLTGTAASGGCGGAIEYLWQYQFRTNCGSWSGWNNWQTVQSVGNWNYTGAPSHRFRRGARRAGCGNWIYSNTITFDVHQPLTDPGTIGEEENECGSYDPAILTNITTASGGCGGAIQYQWQMQTTGTWLDISGAAAAAFDPGTISQTTSYRRAARRVGCGSWIYSNVITKTVNDYPVISAIETTADCGIGNGTIELTFPDHQDYATLEFSTDGGNTYPFSSSDDAGSFTISGLSGGDYQLFARWQTANAVTNVATLGTASASSNFPSLSSTSGAIDGNTNGDWNNSPVYISGNSSNSFWQVDLGTIQTIEAINVWSVTNCCIDYLNGAVVEILDENDVTQFTFTIGTATLENNIPVNGILGRKVRITQTGNYLMLAEVEVLSSPPGCTSDLGSITIDDIDLPVISNIETTADCGSNDGNIELTFPDDPDQATLEFSIDGGNTYPFSSPDDAGSFTISDLPGGDYHLFAGWQTIANVATSGTATASSNYSGSNASHAIDGNTAGIFGNGSVFHSGSNVNPYWEVDLGTDEIIETIKVWNRTNCCGDRLDGAVVEILDENDVVQFTFTIGTAVIENTIPVSGIQGRKVRITQTGDWLQLAEVEVFAHSYNCSLDLGSLTIDNIDGTDVTVLTTDPECGETNGNITLVFANVPDGTYSLNYTDEQVNTQTLPNVQVSGGSATISNLSEGTYNNLVLNNSACLLPLNTNIELVEILPSVSAQAVDSSFCRGQSTTIYAVANGNNGPFTYHWNNGLGTGSNHNINPLSSTTYTVTVVDNNGCTNTGQIAVTVNLCPEVCTDGVDNDGDGLTDCDDPDCQTAEMPLLEDDTFTSCPGAILYDVVSFNDDNLYNPVFSIISSPTSGTVSINYLGEFIYTPFNTIFNANCGSDQFVYEVCNSNAVCCATATVTIHIGDDVAPSLLNVPEDITISCDDDVPVPPLVAGLDDCPGIFMSMQEEDDFGITGSCSNYTITRTWEATDLCGNSVSQSQKIAVVDNVKPEMFTVYTLENGKKLVAGVSHNVSHLWKYVNFPLQFDAPPLLFAQVVSNNDTSAVVAQTKYISNAGFKLRLKEEEGADGLHEFEKVAWLAIEPGSYVGITELEAGILNEIDDNFFTMNYDVSFDEQPVFVASVQGVEEDDPVSIITRSATQQGLQLSLQEEQSADTETVHADEKVAYLALTPNTGFFDENMAFVGESGSVTVDENWQTVSLNNNYNKPVVILGGLPNINNEAAVIRVSNVTQTSFDVRVQEWNYLDGSVPDNSLSYVVVEGVTLSSDNSNCFNEGQPQTGIDIVVIDNCDPLVPLGFNELESRADIGLITNRIWTAIDDCGIVALANKVDTCDVAALKLKVLLSGGLLNNSWPYMMKDELRSKGLLPVIEPFSLMNDFEHVGEGGGESVSASLFENEGIGAIMDWLFIELRSAQNPNKVLSTRSVLLQNDGKVISVDSSDIIYFYDLPAGEYYVTVKHRNHLGVMTGQSQLLSTADPPMIDFTDLETEIFGLPSHANINNDKRSLWAGDFNGDGNTIYQGPGNDVFFLFSKVLSNLDNENHLANYISVGYNREDFNLDGKSIFQGPGNDRAMILYHSILAHPSNTNFLSNYILESGIP
ncbi:MAG: discoidin domain-containing protein [Bacteroidota bacterium]